jgi:hypothetical protein
MRFNFRDKQAPYSYASSLSHNMQASRWRFALGWVALP